MILGERQGRKGISFSTEIHNRVYEGRTRKLKTWHKNKEFSFYGVDIADLTNLRNVDNGF